jgi:thiamine-monophosphate kinase
MATESTPSPEVGAVGTEDALLERIARLVSTVAPQMGEIYVGDDAAVLNPFSGKAIISTDVCVLNVHLDGTLFSLEDLGFKAVTTALSDLAAMGAWPRGLVVAVVAPAGTTIDPILIGATTAAQLCDTVIVGGDVAIGLDVAVTVTVFGECPGDGPVTRSGAQPGDGLYVTGPLGRAAAGLRLARTGAPLDTSLVLAQRRPWPRLREGIALRHAGVHAMMDVSDGLALDLHRLADASGVDFELDDVPVAEGATLAEALGGGEDYELLFTTSDPTALVGVQEKWGLSAPRRIGTVVSAGQGRMWRGLPLERVGWQHRLG